MENKLKDCPFCGGDKFTTHTQSGDERIGYNITHTITCSICGCSKSARSKQDKNGWCAEGSDAVKIRAINAWNTRPEAFEVLKDENESLRKDAERYRWLRSPAVGPNIISTHLFETVSDDVNPPYRTMKIDKELDEAIDRRMQEQK